MTDLASKRCVPCKGGVPPLAGKELEGLARQVPQWKVVNGHHLTRTFQFPDFKQALAFVNKAGEIAEQQGHHPDILLACLPKAISSLRRKSTKYRSAGNLAGNIRHYSAGKKEPGMHCCTPGPVVSPETKSVRN
jgi:hypothetical protein